MKRSTLLLLVLCASVAAAQELVDPAQLVGKKVTVGRLPLCKPGSYTYDLTRAGTQGTVVSVKPHKLPIPISGATLQRMTPDARSLVEDQARAATLLIEFGDGTRLDTCAPLGPKMASEYLTLAPGESLSPPPQNESPVAPQTAQACPVVITKLTEAPVGSMNKTRLAVAIAGNPNVGHVGISYQNQSDKEVLTVRFGLGYVNTMHELDHIEFADTREHKVKPGKSFSLITSTGDWSLGDPTKHVAWVEKILFVDGTYWNDNGSRSCASAALPKP